MRRETMLAKKTTVAGIQLVSYWRCVFNCLEQYPKITTNSI